MTAPTNAAEKSASRLRFRSCIMLMQHSRDVISGKERGKCRRSKIGQGGTDRRRHERGIWRRAGIAGHGHRHSTAQVGGRHRTMPAVPQGVSLRFSPNHTAINNYALPGVVKMLNVRETLKVPVEIYSLLQGLIRGSSPEQRNGEWSSRIRTCHLDH